MSPKLAQSLYQFGVVVSGILGIALIWGGIDQGTADSIGQIIGGIVALVPGATSAVASKRVATQRKDGTFDQLSPAQQVAKGVTEAVQAKAAIDGEIDKIKGTIHGAINDIPVFGPLASAALDSFHV